MHTKRTQNEHGGTHLTARPMHIMLAAMAGTQVSSWTQAKDLINRLKKRQFSTAIFENLVARFCKFAICKLTLPQPRSLHLCKLCSYQKVESCTGGGPVQ
jgi:hypothetical protein